MTYFMRLHAYAHERKLKPWTPRSPFCRPWPNPPASRRSRLLWDGREHCVCELVRVLGVTQSRMSRHMAVLKQAGMVIDRRDAQWVRYRRNPELPAEQAAIVDAVLNSLNASSDRRAA